MFAQPTGKWVVRARTRSEPVLKEHLELGVVVFGLYAWDKPMAARISLQIDLADPDSIRKRLPEVSRVVAGKRAVVAEAQDDLQQWVELEQRLKAIAGVTGISEESLPQPTVTPEPDRASSVQVVVEILEREPRPWRTREVRAVAPDWLKPDTISWALWAAAKDGLIQRLQKGYYAPLSYRMEQIFPNGEKEQPKDGR